MPSPRQPTPGLSARGAFAAEFDGCKNLLTPHVLAYYEQDHPSGRRLLCEISYGQGFEDPLYGLTMLQDDGEGNYSRTVEYNECFMSRHEADAYWDRIARRWMTNGQLD